MLCETAIGLQSIESYVLPVSAKTTWIVVEVILADGSSGFGEATAFGMEDAVAAELALLAAVVKQERPAVPGPALALLAGQARNPARDVVRASLEAALLDAVSRRAGLPLAALLGGPFSDTVRSYANINRSIADRSPAGFAAQARQVVTEDGYTALKIAPFDGYRWDARADRSAFERGIARIAAVREAVGKGVDLMVDCHARFDPATAALLIRETAPFAPYWIEQPMDEARLPAEAHRTLRAAAHDRGIRIAGGEELETLDEAVRLLAMDGHDVILPDLRQTGIRRGMAILDLAVAQGVQASLHNPVGPVHDSASRHVAAAMPSFLILERQVRESPLFDRIGGPVPITAGSVGLGDGAGLGLVPDRAAMRATAARGREKTLSFRGMAGAGPDA